jgi:hypothetical protein
LAQYVYDVRRKVQVLYAEMAGGWKKRAGSGARIVGRVPALVPAVEACGMVDALLVADQPETEFEVADGQVDAGEAIGVRLADGQPEAGLEADVNGVMKPEAWFEVVGQ